MELAVELGAATDKMDFAWWIPTSILPSGQRAFCAAELAKPGCIGVDQSGERFGNEAGSYVATGMSMYARQKAKPAVPCWAVMDHSNRSRYIPEERRVGKECVSTGRFRGSPDTK